MIWRPIRIGRFQEPNEVLATWTPLVFNTAILMIVTAAPPSPRPVRLALSSLLLALNLAFAASDASPLLLRQDGMLPASTFRKVYVDSGRKEVILIR